MKPWTPVRVPRKDGHGTILECRKYAADGSVIDRFALPNHKVGLWALTSGAARNGVFHRFKEPDMVRALATFLGRPHMAHPVNGVVKTPILYREDLFAVYYDDKGGEVTVDLDTFKVNEVYGPAPCLDFEGSSYVYAECVDYDDRCWYTAAGAKKAFGHMVESLRMTIWQLEAFAEEYPQYAEAALGSEYAAKERGKRTKVVGLNRSYSFGDVSREDWEAAFEAAPWMREDTDPLFGDLRVGQELRFGVDRPEGASICAAHLRVLETTVRSPKARTEAKEILTIYMPLEAIYGDHGPNGGVWGFFKGYIRALREERDDGWEEELHEAMLQHGFVEI